VASQERVVADVNVEADRQLVRSIATGSPEALSRLYDRYASTAFGLALRITGRQEDAEEVVQDTFAQIWNQAARYDAARATVAGWLVMVTRARALDRLRARRARPDVDSAADIDATAPIAAAGPTPEDVTITGREAAAVRAALVALPDMLRSLVELAYYDGLTHTEIASKTGMPLGTVKTRLRAATATLRGALSA
jgi:RNA polymerase sigma-70 factor, ECF subfamily